MNSKRLSLFEKEKRVYISPENIIAISWIALIFIVHFLKEALRFNFKGFESGILIFGTIYIIGLMISAFFRK